MGGTATRGAQPRDIGAGGRNAAAMDVQQHALAHGGVRGRGQARSAAAIAIARAVAAGIDATDAPALAGRVGHGRGVGRARAAGTRADAAALWRRALVPAAAHESLANARSARGRRLLSAARHGCCFGSQKCRHIACCNIACTGLLLLGSTGSVVRGALVLVRERRGERVVVPVVIVASPRKVLEGRPEHQALAIPGLCRSSA